MITLNQHRNGITQAAIARYSDDAPVRAGLSPFFPSQTTTAKQVSIEVERNRQLIAVDVQRSTDPNRNTFSKSTEKLFVPPFYNEAWDFTSMDRYDVTFGVNAAPSHQDAVNMITYAANRLASMRAKINRAIELQRAQAVTSGIVQLVNGDNIDYKRKAASVGAVVASGNWTASTGDPAKDIEVGCNFLREEGLSSVSNVHCILGQDAFSAFMNNDAIKEKADFRRISRLELGMPQFDNVTGLVFHGQLGTADYKVNIWTYNEFYEAANGDKTKYIDADKMILIPEDFKGTTAYAGTPLIVRDLGNAEYPAYISQNEGEFTVNNYIDQVKKAHWFEIASAPLAVPVSVDRLYTLAVLTT
ncbi:MAG: hypothetical protein DRQ58_09035 [Gammaproteobacteria bacterium]|nr:MAG: hypothetical protein DRQ58_09035 [Gammaproteobacteria bacterium]